MKQKQVLEPPMQGRQSEEDVPRGNGPSAKPLAWCSAIAMAAWALHLFIGYSLVEWHCHNPAAISNATAKAILAALTVAGFLAAVVSGIFCKKYSAKLARQPVPNSKRTPFLARFGALLCAFLAVLIAAQGLPIVMVAMCL